MVATPISKVVSPQIIGDVKYGFQTSDHNGWIKLDGRPFDLLTDGLTPTQRDAAISIGFFPALPNATNSFLQQNTNPIGEVFGSNSKIINRDNLPNVTLSGTTNGSGDHVHSYERRTQNRDVNGIGGVGVSGQSTSTFNTSVAGGHTHTITTESLNGNITQEELDITPRTLSINVFLFLGD